MHTVKGETFDREKPLLELSSGAIILASSVELGQIVG